jgi:hypothetical protein
LAVCLIFETSTFRPHNLHLFPCLQAFRTPPFGPSFRCPTWSPPSASGPFTCDLHARDSLRPFCVRPPLRWTAVLSDAARP